MTLHHCMPSCPSTLASHTDCAITSVWQRLDPNCHLQCRACFSDAEASLNQSTAIVAGGPLSEEQQRVAAGLLSAALAAEDSLMQLSSFLSFESEGKAPCVHICCYGASSLQRLMRVHFSV